MNTTFVVGLILVVISSGNNPYQLVAIAVGVAVLTYDKFSGKR